MYKPLFNAIRAADLESVQNLLERYDLKSDLPQTHDHIRILSDYKDRIPGLSPKYQPGFRKPLTGKIQTTYLEEALGIIYQINDFIHLPVVVANSNVSLPEYERRSVISHMENLYDIVALLVEHGAGVLDIKHLFSLHQIQGSPQLKNLAHSLFDITRVCLEQGASANAKFYQEKTSSFISIFMYHFHNNFLPENYLRLFMKHGLDVNEPFSINDKPDSPQLTFIAIAFYAEQVELARLLLDAGADVNQECEFSPEERRALYKKPKAPSHLLALGRAVPLRDAEMTLRNANIEPRALMELIERTFYIKTQRQVKLTLQQVLNSMFSSELQQAVKIRLGPVKLQALDEKLALYTQGSRERDCGGSRFAEQQAQGCWFTFKPNLAPPIPLISPKPIKLSEGTASSTSAKSSALKQTSAWRRGFLVTP